ncbi:antibiotic biosynthesis monooxygenase [Segetibacter sp. 3557_3]|uniref:antibiotic biosynthesis monooxygenase family protein n=1 Tax=Segetibacter sp. 3557_3 TaxID=2547429 RepID=UPI001058C147|nr:antibiotic biosynthesis monooxygenase [Segetibacter sp. 3557_3]TDH28507.1 antibiotic biosynthesis monooxygenase [Segetibacter sp. 3557_3]
MIANTSPPPYYAVIFTSLKNDPSEGYAAMAEKMDALAKVQPGYLGVESARAEIGITVSYWKDLDSIRKWKEHSEHLLAQQLGINEWYSAYCVRICLVEREYHF